MVDEDIDGLSAQQRHRLARLADASATHDDQTLFAETTDLATSKYDVFLSHASEDKNAFVKPLYDTLTALNLRVWYDAAEIKIGDDFRRRMEEGLLQSRFGVVILSPSFLKYWPQQELSVLQILESVDGAKRILPVVLNLDWDEFIRQFPFMATRACALASSGVELVAEQIVDATRSSSTRVEFGGPDEAGPASAPAAARPNEPVSLKVHEARFLRWLREPAHQRCFARWFGRSELEDAREADVLEAWKTDQKLDFRLQTMIALVDFLVKEAQEGRKDAALAVRDRVMCSLIPLHEQSPVGGSALEIEIRAARATGGPLQLGFGETATTETPREARALKALQAIVWPKAGLAPLESQDVLRPFYRVIADIQRWSVDEARSELSEGFETYRNVSGRYLDLGLPLENVPRPFYVRVPADTIERPVFDALLRDLKGAIYEEDKGSPDRLIGRLKRAYRILTEAAA